MSGHFTNANERKGDEYLIQILAEWRNPEVEAALRTAVQHVHDVATEQAVKVSIEAGVVDKEVTYVPSPSMTSHIILASHDNSALVDHQARTSAPTIYVKE
jgi:hypothetical protein